MQDPKDFKSKFIESLSSAETRIETGEYHDRKIAKRSFEFTEANKRYQYVLQIDVEFNWKRFFSTNERTTYALATLHDKSGEEFSYIVDINPQKEFIIEGVKISDSNRFSNIINTMVKKAQLNKKDTDKAIHYFKQRVQGFNRSLADTGV